MDSGKRKQDECLAEQPARGRRVPAASMADDDDVDLGSMSPQSRRRYQSRMSSARLRERQRARISNAEEDVTRLESYVRSLQSSIDFHYQSHVPGSQASGDELESRGPGIRLAMGIEDIDDIRDTVEEFLRSKGGAAVEEAPSAGAVDRQIHGSIASMNHTVDHLEQCVRRIDVLKEMIARRVQLLERTTRPLQLPAAPVLGGETLRSTTENSSGSAQGSTVGSTQGFAAGSAPAADGKPAAAGRPSRFSISFLVDEDDIH
ncbi:hypothetical protein H4S02_012542 [Coemansia sp. RSA 2611]|nr:hypothetical protein H4S01_006707 [Coemansia sp. RSA 2610]KAJ2357446.1 hypothetical protein H4S02_012542 [Coemansia sp. RSA 2611]